MGFKIKKTVNGETVWEPIKAKKYTASKTIEYTGALPITINANGQPLLDYRIYGNTEQAGTPTPENPIMPIGCGEKTENLWNGDEVTQIQVTSDASIVRYGIAFSGSTFSLCLISADSLMYYKIKTDNTYGVAVQLSVGVVKAITLTDNQTLLVYGENLTNTQHAIIQINSGTSYIPYGYKLPILSNSTVTNIYLGESQTTRRIKKLVLTGNETIWQKNIDISTSNVYAIRISDYYTSLRVGLCSHYATVYNTSANEGVYFGLDINFLTAVSDEIDTVDKWKSYLATQYAAGTPVTVWYVLAEPETGIVNEPLMKIGDYADTVSMEQAGVSIQTNNGSTAIDYNGTLKPSQMYIKYNSWSGWSDIDNYKMVNGNWTQEMT